MDKLVEWLRFRVPEPGRPYKSEATVLLNPHGDLAADRIERDAAVIAAADTLAALVEEYLDNEKLDNLVLQQNALNAYLHLKAKEVKA